MLVNASVIAVGPPASPPAGQIRDDIGAFLVFHHTIFNLLKPSDTSKRIKNRKRTPLVFRTHVDLPKEYFGYYQLAKL